MHGWAEIVVKKGAGGDRASGVNVEERGEVEEEGGCWWCREDGSHYEGEMSGVFAKAGRYHKMGWCQDVGVLGGVGPCAR